MKHEKLLELVIDALEDRKAKDIVTIDVKDKCSFTDSLVIASGTSRRQVQALAQSVTEQAKKNNVSLIGMEGEGEGEWILVDLGDVVVHVMQPDIREFYQLEKLWNTEFVGGSYTAQSTNN